MVNSVLCKRKSGEVTFNPPLIDDSPGKRARGGLGHLYSASPVDLRLSVQGACADRMHEEQLRFLHQCGCQTLPKEHLIGPNGNLTPIWWVPVPHAFLVYHPLPFLLKLSTVVVLSQKGACFRDFNSVLIRDRLCFSALNVLNQMYEKTAEIPLTRYHTFTRGKKEEIYQR